MEKNIVLLFLLFNFLRCFGGWFSAKNELELARRSFVDIKMELFLNEKKIDECIKRTQKECIKLNFDYKRVLRECIFLTNSKMVYYEEICKQNKINYSTPCALFAASLLSASLFYLIYSYCDSKADIKQKLYDLGAKGVYDWGDSASAWVPYYKKKEAKYLLWRLANNSKISDLIAMSFIGSITSIIGIDNLLDQKYPNFYYQKYYSIKKRLQWHLECKVSSEMLEYSMQDK